MKEAEEEKMTTKLISNWEGVCPIPFFSGVQGIFLLWMTLLANYECNIIFCGGQGLGQESWAVKGREEYVNLDSASASAVRSLPQKNPSSFPKTTAFSIQKSQSLPSFARAIKDKKITFVVVEQFSILESPNAMTDCILKILVFTIACVPD